jgi:hypothetical protein
MHDRHFKERRKAPRIAKPIPLQLHYNDFDLFLTTKNLSANGMYCECDQFIPLMSKLFILLFVPSLSDTHLKHKQVLCKGTVVRTEQLNHDKSPRYNIAIYFNEITSDTKDILLEYIRYNLESENSSTYS